MQSLWQIVTVWLLRDLELECKIGGCCAFYTLWINTTEFDIIITHEWHCLALGSPLWSMTCFSILFPWWSSPVFQEIHCVVPPNIHQYQEAPLCIWAIMNGLRLGLALQWMLLADRSAGCSPGWFIRGPWGTIPHFPLISPSLLSQWRPGLCMRLTRWRNLTFPVHYHSQHLQMVSPVSHAYDPLMLSLIIAWLFHLNPWLILVIIMGTSVTDYPCCVLSAWLRVIGGKNASFHVFNCLTLAWCILPPEWFFFPMASSLLGVTTHFEFKSSLGFHFFRTCLYMVSKMTEISWAVSGRLQVKFLLPLPWFQASVKKNPRDPRAGNTPPPSYWSTQYGHEAICLSR